MPKLKRYTVSYDPTVRYYLSVQVETAIKSILKAGRADLAISSDGVKNANWLEAQATK